MVLGILIIGAGLGPAATSGRIAEWNARQTWVAYDANPRIQRIAFRVLALFWIAVRLDDHPRRRMKPRSRQRVGTRDAIEATHFRSGSPLTQVLRTTFGRAEPGEQRFSVATHRHSETRPQRDLLRLPS